MIDFHCWIVGCVLRLLGLIGYAGGFGFPVVAGFCLNIFFVGLIWMGLWFLVDWYNIVCGGFGLDW